MQIFTGEPEKIHRRKIKELNEMAMKHLNLLVHFVMFMMRAFINEPITS